MEIVKYKDRYKDLIDINYGFTTYKSREELEEIDLSNAIRRLK